MKKYSDIKKVNKVRKVLVGKRHPHITSWDEMLKLAAKI